uniref:Uncharacterized protein n=1 Tax=Rhizophora mucronata TaxID=61149 RepID=A0A2P2QIX7_RHIMU
MKIQTEQVNKAPQKGQNNHWEKN